MQLVETSNLALQYNCQLYASNVLRSTRWTQSEDYWRYEYISKFLNSIPTLSIIICMFFASSFSAMSTFSYYPSFVFLFKFFYCSLSSLSTFIFCSAKPAFAFSRMTCLFSLLPSIVSSKILTNKYQDFSTIRIACAPGYTPVNSFSSDMQSYNIFK